MTRLPAFLSLLCLPLALMACSEDQPLGPEQYTPQFDRGGQVLPPEQETVWESGPLPIPKKGAIDLSWDLGSIGFSAPYYLEATGDDEIEELRIELDGKRVFGNKVVGDDGGTRIKEVDLTLASELQVTRGGKDAGDDDDPATLWLRLTGVPATSTEIGDPTSTDPVETVLQGGDVTLTVIPANVVPPGGTSSDPIVLSVQPSTAPLPPSPGIIVESLYEFGPAGTTFVEPIPLTVGYDPDGLPPGVDEEDLALNLLKNGRFVVLPGSSVNTATKKVSAPVNHFSTMGPGEAALALFCPGDSDPDTFETLTDAVTAVVEGGTVEVCPGTHVVASAVSQVNKAITLEGGTGNRPTIRNDPAQSAYGIVVIGLADATAPGTLLIRNLRFETDWPGSDNLPAALLIDKNPHQVVVDDVEVHTLNGGSGITVNKSSSVGASLTVQNATFTADPPTASRQNGIYVTVFVSGDAPVTVENSTFSSILRALVVDPAVASSGRVVFDNVTVTGGGFGILSFNQDLSVAGPVVDVLNSDFSGNRFVFARGSSGRIEGNTFSDCPGSCLEVNDFAGVGIQPEPLQVISNQFSFSGPNMAGTGLRLVSLNSGPFDIRDNTFTGVAPTGDRTDPTIYSITGEAIRILNPDVAGSISGNALSGAFVGLQVDGGTGQVTALDNSIAATNTVVETINGGLLSVQSSDLTDYIVPIGTLGTFGTGDLTCNWWGGVAGPVGPDPGVSADVYTPWALASVAGTSTTTCSGGP